MAQKYTKGGRHTSKRIATRIAARLEFIAKAKFLLGENGAGLAPKIMGIVVVGHIATGYSRSAFRNMKGPWRPAAESCRVGTASYQKSVDSQPTADTANPECLVIGVVS